jgi:hypothetical protein
VDWVWSKHAMEEEQQQRIELEVHVSCGGMGVITKDWIQSRHVGAKIMAKDWVQSK